MGGRRSFDGRDGAGALGRREVHVVSVREKLVPVMRNEPQHIAPVVQKVLADIAVAWERHHGKPVPDRIRKMIDGEDEETDVAPCRRRSRDPPTENCA